MYIVTQSNKGRILYGVQEEDDDGFVSDSWTAQRERATEFRSFEDDANHRHIKGYFLMGYAVAVQEV